MSWGRAALSSLAFFLALTISCGGARAESHYRALSDPAVAVKNPDQVLLETVALAGNRVVAAGEHGVIIYSDDDGRSWRQAAVPVDVMLTAVAFATPLEGWAAGAMGVVLHTDDGGMTWKAQLNGIRVNQLIAVAANQFALSHPNDPSTPRVLRRASIFAQTGPDKPFLSILPFTADDIQIYGAYRMCVKTADAGTNWQDCSLDVPDPVSHNLYDAVLSSTSIYIAGESGATFRSDDQGRTFSQLTAPAEVTLLGILATPSHTLLSFGVAGSFFRSTDQGQTWSNVQVGSQSNLTAGLILKSGIIVIFTETGDIFVSHDDGMSFMELQSNDGMGIFGAVQVPDGDIILVGTNGVRNLTLNSLNWAKGSSQYKQQG